MKKAKKRVVRKKTSDADLLSVQKSIEEDIEEVEKEAVEVEKWIIARRKFFIKLGIVILFVILLILLTNYMP